MIYSHEVETMCPGCTGRSSRMCPDSGRSKMGTVQTGFGYFWPDSRYWLVCSAAGRLQTDLERKRRHHPGSTGRNDRLLGYDPFGCYGC